MFDNHLRYHAVAFVDAESVKPNQEEITSLIGQFSDLQLVPVATQEVTAATQEHRIGFIAQDNSWQVFILGKRFQVVRLSPSPLGSDLGELQVFCDQANKILKWALNRFQRHPHRLAVVQEGILNRTGDEIDAIGKRLLLLPNTFKENPLDEWDWRGSARVSRLVGDHDETLNTIATIKRLKSLVEAPTSPSAPVTPPPKKVPFIRADIDINTSQEDTSARFHDAHMDAFFGNVTTWHNELIADIERLIKREL